MNGNLTITANFVAATYTLTVAKAGLGAGSVTGTGINCGTDCTENLGSVSVTLTATPASGSAFDHWAGCDVVSANACTVTMTASRTVTATFSLSLAPPTVSVPATSTTGSYNVTVTCSGLCSTTFVLQEAPTTAFVNPTQTFYSNSSFPRVIAFSGKPAGTYCYRAAFSAPPNPVSPSTIAGIFTVFAMNPANIATSVNVSNPISGNPAVQFASPAPLI